MGKLFITLLTKNSSKLSAAWEENFPDVKLL